MNPGQVVGDVTVVQFVKVNHGNNNKRRAIYYVRCNTCGQEFHQRKATLIRNAERLNRKSCPVCRKGEVAV